MEERMTCDRCTNKSTCIQLCNDMKEELAELEPSENWRLQYYDPDHLEYINFRALLSHTELCMNCLGEEHWEELNKIGVLAPRELECFRCIFWDCLSQHETAEVLGVKQQTVFNSVKRGLAKLSDIYKK